MKKILSAAIILDETVADTSRHNNENIGNMTKTQVPCGTRTKCLLALIRVLKYVLSEINITEVGSRLLSCPSVS